MVQRVTEFGVRLILRRLIMANSMYWIAIKENVATVAALKLTMGIKPSLPKHRFIGPYETKGKAEKSIPFGLEYKGKVVGSDSKK